MKVVLLGEPKSTQSIYKYACRGSFPTMYMTKEGKDIKESYQIQAKSQYRGEPLSEALTVTVALFFRLNRVHDIDNYNKLLLDACTGVLWNDDSQIEHMITTKAYDKDNPRIELTVNKL